MITLHKIDGSVHVLTDEHDYITLGAEDIGLRKEPTLEDLRKWIGGGFIEIVTLNVPRLGPPGQVQMVVDEEGLIKWGKEYQNHLNVVGSMLYIETAIRNIGWANGLSGITPILGPAVVLTAPNLCS